MRVDSEDIALLFMRVMAGLVFSASGVADLKDPDARSKSIELPRAATQLLGAAEVLGGVAVMTGVLIKPAATAATQSVPGLAT